MPTPPPPKQQADPIIKIYILVIAVVFVTVYFRNAHEQQAKIMKARQDQIDKLNTIRTGDWDGEDGENQVSLGAYQDFDYMKKSDLLQARKINAQAGRKLLLGGYEPDKKLFKNMRDEAPWYGQQGQYCFGAGNNVINGLSEYSQEFLTPLMLLSVKENYFLNVKDPQECVVVLPQVLSLEYHPQFNNAYLTYDLSAYLNQRRGLKTTRPGTAPVFALTNFNAVDFGYQFVSITEADCLNIRPLRAGTLFGKIIPLRQTVTYTKNCGVEEGCNLVAPFQTQLAFQIGSLPARLYCRLWKERPQTEPAAPEPGADAGEGETPPPGGAPAKAVLPDDEADFEFIIDFQ